MNRVFRAAGRIPTGTTRILPLRPTTLTIRPVRLDNLITRSSSKSTSITRFEELCASGQYQAAEKSFNEIKKTLSEEGRTYMALKVLDTFGSAGDIEEMFRFIGENLEESDPQVFQALFRAYHLLREPTATSKLFDLIEELQIKPTPKTLEHAIGVSVDTDNHTDVFRYYKELSRHNYTPSEDILSQMTRVKTAPEWWPDFIRKQFESHIQMREEHWQKLYELYREYDNYEESGNIMRQKLQNVKMKGNTT